MAGASGFENVFAWAPDPVLIHRDGVLVFVNDAALRTLGYASSEQLLGVHVLDALIHPDEAESVQARLRALRRHEASRLPAMELRMRRGDGTWAQLEASASRISIDGADHIAVMARDLTNARLCARRLEDLYAISGHLQTAADEGLHKALEVAAEALEVPVAMVSKFEEGCATIEHAVGCSRGGLSPFGEASTSVVVAARDTVAITDIELSDYRLHPGLRNAGFRSYLGAPIYIGEQRYGALEFGGPTPRASWSHDDLQLAHVLARSFGSVLETRRARSALSTAHDEMARLAFIDELTGLPNRRDARHRLKAAMGRAEDQQSRLSVALLDVDHFKTVNGRFGREVGNQVLRRVARRIRRSLQGSDYAARFGGDEFIIIWPNSPIAAAQVAANRVRQVISGQGGRRATLGSSSLPRVTVSLGLAQSDGGERFERVIQRAGDVLSSAKRAGRDRVAVAPPFDET